jgi:hypothetical protein
MKTYALFPVLGGITTLFGGYFAVAETDVGALGMRPLPPLQDGVSE